MWVSGPTEIIVIVIVGIVVWMVLRFAGFRKRLPAPRDHSSKQTPTRSFFRDTLFGQFVISVLAGLVASFLWSVLSG